MAETFTVKQDLHYTELWGASFYVGVRSKLVQKVILYEFGIGIFGALVDAFLPSKFEKTWYTVAAKIFLLPVGTALFFLLLSFPVVIILLKLRPAEYKNISYTFTHWGMEKLGNGMAFSRQWRKILRLKETRKYFYFFISDNDAHVIQKRMFTSEAELQSFRQFVQENMKAG